MFRPILTQNLKCLPKIVTNNLSKCYFSGNQGSLAKLSYEKLKIEKSQKLKEIPALEKMEFGKLFTDHMLVVNWDDVIGWHTPQIKPYAPFSLDPAASVLHYGLEAFEGNMSKKKVFFF